MLKVLFVAAVSLAVGSGVALADDFRAEKTVALGLANDMAAEAVKSCTAAGYFVTAVVVDRQGYIKAMQRADNAQPHSIEIAQRKAFTAAMLRYETARLADNIKNGRTPASLTQIAGFTGLIGGFPLKVGEEVVGGIGVSGAPAGELDSACAEAALKLLAGRV